MKFAELYYDEFKTPIGSLTIWGTDQFVLRIDFGAHKEVLKKRKNWLDQYHLPGKISKNTVFARDIKKQLDQYFHHQRKTFQLNFYLFGTLFQKKIWKTLYESTHYGETKTYQDLALEVDNPKAIRAVGGALNKNPISIIIPCHRIVGKNGHLTGYGGGIDKKAFLLQHEQKINF